MKKLLFLMMFLLCVTKLAAQNYETTFEHLPEAREASDNGAIGNYDPSHLSGFKETSIGEREVTLPNGSFVRMKVAGGKFLWVLPKDGAIFIADSTTGKIKRMKKCGNEVLAVAGPNEKKVIRSLALKPEPAEVQAPLSRYESTTSTTLIETSSDAGYWVAGVAVAAIATVAIVAIVNKNHNNRTTTVAATGGVAPGGNTGPSFREFFPPTVSIGYGLKF